MKKLLYCAVALAVTLFAGSCQKENLEQVKGGKTVTFTVAAPGQIQTKAIADGMNVDVLHYEVYSREQGAPNQLEIAADSPLAKGHVNMTPQQDPKFPNDPEKVINTATVELDLLKDQDLTIIFWAQVKGAGYYNVTTDGSTDLRKISFKPNKKVESNVEARAAFYKRVDFNTDNNLNYEVELVRPFAQLNLGTTEESLNPVQPGQTIGYSIDVLKSEVTVKGICTSFNTVTGLGENENEDVVYVLNDTPYQQTKNDSEPEVLTVQDKPYHYVSMNYLFVPGGDKLVEVSYTVKTDKGDIQNTIKNVPVKQNFRTNIIGNLLTSKTKFDIVVDEEFNKPDIDLEYKADGLVQVNPDLDADSRSYTKMYEISTANGFAYAMTQLVPSMKDGESAEFYLLNSIDMEGVNYVPSAVRSRVMVHLGIGAAPITRSTSGIVITGLDSPIFARVENGGTASFSNIVIEGYNSDDNTPAALVGVNNGTVVYSACAATDEDNVNVDLIGSGQGQTIDATGVTSVAQLNAALASGVNVITLASDIEAKDIIVINKAMTIDGAGFTLKSTAGRAINVSGADGVVIKNMTIEASGERAINIIQNANNITIENVTATAANYTVNIAASASDVQLIINNSVLTGLNTINVAGPGADITVNDTKIISNDQNEVENYSAISINKDGVGSVVTVNGGKIVVKDDSDAGSVGAVDAEIIFNNVTGATQDDVVYVSYAIEYGNYYYGFSTLAEAITKAESGQTIKVIRDVVETAGIVVKADKNIALDLNGKTVSGESSVTGKNYNMIDVRGILTVKNGTITAEFKGANMGWNNSTNVFNVTAGGVLNLENVTAKNLGGSDMGFIAHLNNWGEVTLNVENCTLESNYVAVRVFNSGYDMNNVTIKNSTLKGGNYAFWVHNYTVADFGGDAKKTAAQHALLNFDIFNGTNTFIGKNQTPIRLGMTNSLYLNAEGECCINTAAELKAFAIAVNNGDYFKNKTVKLINDIDLNNEEWTPIGSAYLDHGFMGNFDGNNKTIKNLKISNIKPDADGYVYAALFGVTEGIDKDNENWIRNLTIENVKIITEGDIVSAAVAYPYYTNIENITVKGNVNIQGGNYTSGVLAYTRRCVNAKNLDITANPASAITGKQTVGGVISDIQMNGGLTANYSNFKASGLIITGEKSVGGISGIISLQSLDGATVENVSIKCNDLRKGSVSGALGGISTIKNINVTNVTGADNYVGATYDEATSVVQNGDVFEPASANNE